jgi:hypothetical protein
MLEPSEFVCVGTGHDLVVAEAESTLQIEVLDRAVMRVHRSLAAGWDAQQKDTAVGLTVESVHLEFGTLDARKGHPRHVLGLRNSVEVPTPYPDNAGTTLVVKGGANLILALVRSSATKGPRCGSRRVITAP